MDKWGPHDFSPQGGRRQLARTPRTMLTQDSKAAWAAWLEESIEFVDAAHEWDAGNPSKLSLPWKSLGELQAQVTKMQNWLQGLRTDGRGPAPKSAGWSRFYDGP